MSILDGIIMAKFKSSLSKISFGIIVLNYLMV